MAASTINDEIKKFIDNPRSFIDYDKILTDDDIYKLKKLVKHKNFDTLLDDNYYELFDRLNNENQLSKLENMLTTIGASSLVSFTSFVIYAFLKHKFRTC